MNGSEKLRVILFALTGFGNPVLAALLQDSRVKVEAVFTVIYKNPLPYYDEKPLDLMCQEYSIPCFGGIKVTSDEGQNLLRSYSPDLILVATFKQILSQKILDLPRLGVVNFHPSLLPKYRGPCPSNAALLHGEAVTGVTIHYVTEGVDEGDILCQRIVDINGTDIDGRLRQKLAAVCGEMVPELIGMFAGFNKPQGRQQNHQLASFAPKPAIEEGYLESAADIQTVERKMKGLNPLPGTSILVGQRRIIVDRFERLSSKLQDGIYEQEDFVDWFLNSQALRLYKQKVNS